MNIDTDEDKSRIEANYGAGSIAYYRLHDLMVALYNEKPNPERPTHNTLPDGSEEYVLKCLEIAAEGAVSTYVSAVDMMKIYLSTIPDYPGLMYFKLPTEEEDE